MALDIKYNDPKNGFVYKEFNDRMNRIESALNELSTNYNQMINNSNLDYADFATLLKTTESKADTQLLLSHSNDSNIHLEKTKKVEWDNKIALDQIKNIVINRSTSGVITSIEIHKLNGEYKTIEVINK